VSNSLYTAALAEERGRLTHLSRLAGNTARQPFHRWSPNYFQSRPP